MSRFKTELCNNLIELGTCKYGDRCHYAHGQHELRQVSRRHPKYRTETCKNFELTGKCPFGPRCSYVHPKPDLDQLIEQLTRYMKHKKAPKPESDDELDVEILEDESEKENRLFDSRTNFNNPSNEHHSSSNLAEVPDFLHYDEEGSILSSLNRISSLNQITRQIPVPAMSTCSSFSDVSLPLLNYSNNQTSGKKLRLISDNNSSITAATAADSNAQSPLPSLRQLQPLTDASSANYINCAEQDFAFGAPHKKVAFERNQNVLKADSSNSNDSKFFDFKSVDYQNIASNASTSSDFKTLRSIFSNDPVAPIGNNSSNRNLLPNKQLYTRF